jgi:Phytanoyl-CoA dioxygenase (PhyH)
VPDLLSPDELRAAVANVGEYVPTAEEMAAGGDGHAAIRDDPFHIHEFPFGGDALNRVTVHPELVAFAERAIGTTELALHQSLIWAKYGGGAEHDQELHVDYGNNSLAYPRDDGIYRYVQAIVYYTDVTLDHGPTHVVSEQNSRGLLLEPRRRSREAAPELYRHEQPIVATAGSALLYGMRTWHRGSAFRARDGARFTHHIGFRAAAVSWMGWRAWARFAAEPELHRFLVAASPRERELLGFPPPRHPYWNDETVAGVAARYPEMDVTPYRTW